MTMLIIPRGLDKCQVGSTERNTYNPEMIEELCGVIASGVSIRKSSHPVLYAWILDQTDAFPASTKIRQRIHAVTNGIASLPCCKTCGSEVRFRGPATGYDTYCSIQCRADDTEWTSKVAQTNKQRYGDAVPMRSASVRDRYQATCLAKYGTEWAVAAQVVQEQAKHSMLVRYGAEHYVSSQQFMDQQLITRQHRGGRSNQQLHYSDEAIRVLSDPNLLRSKNQDGMQLGEIAMEIGVSISVVSAAFARFDIAVKRDYGSSRGEQQIRDWLTTAGCQVVANDRTIIGPLELDMVIPDAKIAIEYCGLYWHADSHDRITNVTHWKKHQACQTAGYRLITIFEDEWVHRPETVKSVLSHKLHIGDSTPVIGARSATVIIPTRTQKREFFDRYHLQGNGGGSVTYALSVGTTVVAMMTFIKRAGDGTYELNRYATAGCSVRGGFSRLLSTFQRNHRDWRHITSFADLRWSDGGVYKKHGFVEVSHSKPSYWYCIGTHRYHRANFMKHRLPQKIKVYDPTLTEFNNCDNAGLLRIWDCGQLKFALSR